MWATTHTLVPFFSNPISFSNHSTPPPASFPTAANTLRRSLHPVAAAGSSKDIGGLGQAVLSALNSSPSPTTTANNNNNAGSNPTQTAKPKGERKQEKKKKEVSGSDILWAMQRASAKKAQVSSNKKQHQKKGSVQLTRDNSKRVIDYDKVRPIIVKSDWATRLDDLEKRLQEYLSI